MRYLLDTNVCVMYLNVRSTLVRDRLLSVSLKDVAVVRTNSFSLPYFNSST
jgi:tRNA(fMet)-specific endonuclease VapC